MRTSYSTEAERLLAHIRAQTVPWAGHSISDVASRMIGAEEVEAFRLISGRPDATLADYAGMSTGMVDVWTGMAMTMLQLARSVGDSGPIIQNVPDTILVSALDTHLVNAASYGLADGSCLIVLNDALIDLVYEACRVLATLVDLPGTQSGPDLRQPEARRAMTALLDWIRLSGHAHGVDLVIKDRPRLLLATELAYAVEEFVIAHEVAHLVLGHHDPCNGGRSLLIEVENPPHNRTTSEYQAEELIADGWAILTVLHLRQRRDDSSDQLLAIDGARLFLALQAEVERLTRAQEFPSGLRFTHELTHPPAETRLQSLREVVITNVSPGEEAWARSGAFTAAFASLVQDRNVTLRDQCARDWLEERLSTCSQGPIPDYAGFRSALADESQDFRDPVILAAMASAMVQAEGVLRQPQEGHANGSSMDDLTIGSWMRYKLMASYINGAPRQTAHAFREMYVRAGGQENSGLLTPQQDDRPG